MASPVTLNNGPQPQSPLPSSLPPSPTPPSLHQSASGTHHPNTTSSSSHITNGPAATAMKPQSRPNPTGSRVMPNSGRRPSASPTDAMQRRNSSQKAWTQGTNPITQRPSAYHQLNGVKSEQKVPTKATSKETNTPDKHAHDRLLFLLANFIGRTATVTVANGDKFEGIFAGSSLEPSDSACVLKMVKQTTFGAQHQTNGVKSTTSDYTGSGPDHVMSFEMKDVVDITVDTVTFFDAPSRVQNGTASNFRTDADISGNLAVRERNLQRWEPSTGPDEDLSLEGGGNGQNSRANGGWDQFEANERLYGVRSDYDENIYTTAIDRSNPLYRQRAAAADRIAREIEGGTAASAHIAEERGGPVVDDSGMDEEEKYSGVRREPQSVPPVQSRQPNKYTPPARRPPTGQPTVAGAPVDPAIISSQMARPAPSPSTESQDPTSAGPVEIQPSSKQGADKTIAPPMPTPNASDSATVSGLPASKGNSVTPAKPDSSQKQSTQATPSGPSGTSTPSSKPSNQTATATVEVDLLDSFKNFASVEKLRYQEHRRNQAKHVKDHKLNDLRRWAVEFKLKSLPPKDIIPVLAKDPEKQERIVEKARRDVEEAKHDPPPISKAPVTAPSSKTQRPANVGRFDPGNGPVPSFPDRHAGMRGRSGHPSQGMPNQQHMRPGQPHNLPAIPARSGPGLGARLANIQQQNKAGLPVSAIPSPAPIHEGRVPPTGPALMSTETGAAKFSGTPTPTSATSMRFNVKALEFKPNPASTSFAPNGNPTASPSPKSTAGGRPSPRVTTPSSFFGSRKPLPPSERPSIGDYFNPIKRLRKEAEENKEDWRANGGIRPAHKTAPRWDVTGENKDRSYTEMFDKVPFSAQTMSPSQPPHANPQLAHQHQLPFHLQHGGPAVPPSHTPHQAGHHLHPQQQHHPMAMPHHHDDHRMHLSASSSSYMPSPRMQQVNVAYHSPMGQHAQLVYPQGMTQYGVGPGGPHVPHFRQYSGGPQFMSQQNSQMGAPMMAHGPSNGPFMGVPQGLGAPFNHQMPMYSPSQAHAHPQYGGPPPPMPGSGYPSPGRGAPMMMHQGSQQGQPPQQMMPYGMSPGHQAQPMYGPQHSNQGSSLRGGAYPPMHQPHFGVSPHQGHQFPHQGHRGGHGGHYGHAPMHPQGGPPQGPGAPQHHANEGVEEKK
ncbi:MAG: hypothetical protein M1817_006104 [Caeruleum heppii]|nr:MAG: hypothetical protein M1817_006104 [Caeruleum heppii]